jgi:hypothetical protein
MQAIINDIAQASTEKASNLAGYAADAAVKTLVTNWRDAHHDQYPGFGPATLASDLDEVIALLTNLKLRAQASASPPARAAWLKERS